MTKIRMLQAAVFMFAGAMFSNALWELPSYTRANFPPTEFPAAPFCFILFIGALVWAVAMEDR